MGPIEKKSCYELARELVMAMNGLSEDGFNNRYLCDPAFHKATDVIVELYLQQPKIEYTGKPINFGLVDDAERNGLIGPFGEGISH